MRRQAAVVARLERRQGVERRREGERPPFFDRDVAHVGHVDRLDAALPQRVLDGARDEIVRDLMEDLLFEPLPDDAVGRLAGPEAGQTRLARIVADVTVDFRIDHVAWDFDAHVLPRFVHVDELGLHSICQLPVTSVQLPITIVQFPVISCCFLWATKMRGLITHRCRK